MEVGSGQAQLQLISGINSNVKTFSQLAILKVEGHGKQRGETTAILSRVYQTITIQMLIIVFNNVGLKFIPLLVKYYL